MTSLLFSTIIPVYNRAELAAAAVESALNQESSDQEIIVVDDGSTDGSAEALDRRFGNRIRVLRQENKGPGPARIWELKMPLATTSHFSIAMICGSHGL